MPDPSSQESARKAAQGVGRALGATGRRIRKQVDKVNPDVWREFASVATLAPSLLCSRREKVVNKGRSGERPIVMVHGLGGNRGTWWPMRYALMMHGRRRMYAFGYGPGAVVDHADSLVKFVERVLEVTGEPKVDLLGHSLGGIIARYALQVGGLEGKVNSLITIASPHHGTYAAHFANTVELLSLRPGSEILSRINEHRVLDSCRRFVCIYSDRDIWVLPHNHMSHEEAENIYLPGLSHSQFLIAPQVFKIVDRLLDDTALEEYHAAGDSAPSLS
ncbi:MAG: alpha/beta fold hydrolase [Deltaproteobacteria bacterium]|nr:alpha/beta fold hydrolase [bacterium]MCB9477525.1 alpha/beta fold hydrolase [Deltaproteobacteria bacterium]MCB9488088.1 alpha/beta fold hydrolase [Deltaproteobacteria bacterium]